MQPELAFVSAWPIVVVDAVEIELPSAWAAEEGSFDRNSIADFPAEAFGGASAGDGALAVVQESFPLIVGNDHLGEDYPLIFDVDRKLREEILFVLIDAAEPVVVSDGFDAGDGEDFVAVGDGQRLNDGRAVDYHEAVCAGYFHAAAKGAFNYG